MSTIPNLNLKDLTPGALQALNRWADSVTTALAEANNRVKATNQQAASTSNILSQNPIVTIHPPTQTTQQQIFNPHGLPSPPKPVRLDNVPDGTIFNRIKATHAAAGVAYNFKSAWSSVASYVIGDEVTNANIYWIALANNTNSVPAVGNANWQAVGRIQGDVQIFTATGTWSKPAAGTFAIVTCIGGGCGGSSGTAVSTGTGFGGIGGFPGGISGQTMPLSVLGATESVVIGAGGAGGAYSIVSTSNPGTAGGATSFGVWLQATGGTTSATGGGNQNNASLSFLGGQGGHGGSALLTSGNPGAVGSNGASARQSPIAGGTGGAGDTESTRDAVGGNGGTGTAATTDEPSGGGGGGGGGGASVGANLFNATGGTGGAGGIYGAGGGGGGSAFGSGGGSNIGAAGGSGSGGIVIVAVY